MSKLEELIQRYCPDGVEYKTFADVCAYEQPGKYIVDSADYSDDFDVPVLTAGQTFILGYTNEKHNLYPASKDTPVIIFDDFTGAFKWVDFPFKVKSSAMKMITATTKSVLLRYVYHYMGVINYSSSEHTRLWIGTYSNFEIPIPPLPVQEEIVRVLDTFTELQAELQAELQKRLQQYNYYRDNLLSFEEEDSTIGNLVKKYCPNGVEYKTIKKVYKRLKGTPITAGKMKEINKPDGTIRVFAGGRTVIDANEEDIPNANITRVPAVLVQSRGVIDVVYYDKPFTFKNEMWAYTIDNQTSVKYLYYVLKNNIQVFRDAASGMGSLPQISLGVTEDFEISVPPLPIQQKIVDVLDRFDTLINDLTTGLPAEIEKRKQQYEYYRDRLLTFKRVV